MESNVPTTNFRHNLTSKLLLFGIQASFSLLYHPMLQTSQHLQAARSICRAYKYTLFPVTKQIKLINIHQVLHLAYPLNVNLFYPNILNFNY